jgi:isoleucyl-tRNA synthetase
MKMRSKKPKSEKIQGNFLPEDTWMVSRINSVTREVTLAFEAFDLHVAARVLSSFILEDLSRWYVRLARARTWVERDDPAKLAVYIVLYQSLHTLVRLLAPLMPYSTEVMYRGLVRVVDDRAPESVHMLPWPSAHEGAIDASTFMGKGVGQIAARCREQGIPCVALAGLVGPSVKRQKLFARVHALTELTTIERAKANPSYWLEQLAARVSQSWKANNPIDCIQDHQ